LLRKNSQCQTKGIKSASAKNQEHTSYVSGRKRSLRGVRVAHRGEREVVLQLDNCRRRCAYSPPIATARGPLLFSVRRRQKKPSRSSWRGRRSNFIPAAERQAQPAVAPLCRESRQQQSAGGGLSTTFIKAGGRGSCRVRSGQRGIKNGPEPWADAAKRVPRAFRSAREHQLGKKRCALSVGPAGHGVKLCDACVHHRTTIAFSECS
jgi:hypothetical protein